MLSSSSTIRGRGGCGTRRARASHRFRTPPLGCIGTAASPCAHDQSKRSKGAWYTLDEYVQRYGDAGQPLLERARELLEVAMHTFPTALSSSVLTNEARTYVCIHPRYGPKHNWPTPRPLTPNNTTSCPTRLCFCLFEDTVFERRSIHRICGRRLYHSEGDPSTPCIHQEL